MRVQLTILILGLAATAGLLALPTSTIWGQDPDAAWWLPMTVVAVIYLVRREYRWALAGAALLLLSIVLVLAAYLLPFVLVGR